MSTPGIFAAGADQTLTYGTGGGQIVVELGNSNFAPGKGQGFELWLGYDRVQEAEFRRTVRRTMLGGAYLQGPSFDAPHNFAWSLQLLTDQQFAGLLDIATRQQKEKLPCRLLDGRLLFCESSPRTRAKLGGLVSRPSAGMVCYWAQFDVWLDLPSPPTPRTGGDHELRLTAVELSKVPLSEDLP